MKTVAVLQSNYIPWKGYFDIIHDVDLFIFYDDVQFTKNDWRNRNKLKGTAEPQWLTVPVGSRLDRLICEVEITDNRWQKKHWQTIEQFYAKAPYFSLYRDFFADVYLDKHWDNLSELNHYLITHIAADFLGITTAWSDSRQFSCPGTRQDRLLSLLRQAEADRYVSGPAARDYIEETAFQSAGIELIYKDYGGYPEYPQFYPPFSHQVSILDLLFQTGPDAPYFIWGWRENVPKEAEANGS